MLINLKRHLVIIPDNNPFSLFSDEQLIIIRVWLNCYNLVKAVGSSETNECIKLSDALLKECSKRNIERVIKRVSLIYIPRDIADAAAKLWTSWIDADIKFTNALSDILTGYKETNDTTVDGFKCYSILHEYNPCPDLVNAAKKAGISIPVEKLWKTFMNIRKTDCGVFEITYAVNHYGNIMRHRRDLIWSKKKMTDAVGSVCQQTGIKPTDPFWAERKQKLDELHQAQAHLGALEDFLGVDADCLNELGAMLSNIEIQIQEPLPQGEGIVTKH